MPEPDGATTLEELERKLRELEEELQGAAHRIPDHAGARSTDPPAAGRAPEIGLGGPVAPALPSSPAAEAAWLAGPPPSPSQGPRPDPAPPAPSEPEAAAPPSPEPGAAAPAGPEPDAAAPSAPVAPALQALAAFRAQLERATQELLEGFAVTFDAVAAAPPAPAPVLPASPWAAAAAAPWASGADAPDPAGVVLEGAVTVDVGPFADIAGLAAFEQAVRAVPGAREVHVRGFQGSYALLALVLSAPVALGEELRRTSPVPLTVTRAGAGVVAIALEPRS